MKIKKATTCLGLAHLWRSVGVISDAEEPNNLRVKAEWVATCNLASRWLWVVAWMLHAAERFVYTTQIWETH